MRKKKMFQNFHLAKGWYTELKNAINKQTPNNPTLKWDRDINKYFSMEESDNFINSNQLY